MVHFNNNNERNRMRKKEENEPKIKPFLIVCGRKLHVQINWWRSILLYPIQPNQHELYYVRMGNSKKNKNSTRNSIFEFEKLFVRVLSVTMNTSAHRMCQQPVPLVGWLKRENWELWMMKLIGTNTIRRHSLLPLLLHCYVTLFSIFFFSFLKRKTWIHTNSIARRFV